jgi:pyruvate formate lyase activating enzyme
MSATLADREGRRGLVADTISFSSVDGPGNRFVVFLQGCNFDCIACHNPQTIPGHGGVDGHAPRRLGVGDLLLDIRRAAPFISGITVSGGEATQQPAFVRDLFAAIKGDPALTRLTCFVDSNGSCRPEVWDELDPVMDGAMVDLKCLDPAIHQALTGQPNADVLASIGHLQRLGKLYEVRLLLLAGVNDDPALLVRTAEWLATVHPHLRLRVIGLRLHGTRPHDPPMVEPTSTSLAAAARLLADRAPFDISVV